ncbi:hypothetical protein YSA_p00045 (plasmid) [Pseudomonas putida ND6]|uniref:Uncharacterized protein n=1 Tax=Pseudomonas putida ND6 TaxID=231023 RepID=I3V5E8_PSEPU|nr:hypothetical protein [Pseudomonas aeruginosa]AFK72969.1 hypothetical protein YSA_p00045 [Pseudomonas putida ND6]UVN18721.1 Hypothetical protein [Pseudomonas aeruginosa]UVN18993.1 hypothetical protein [Pseudomonas aeruginosa]
MGARKPFDQRQPTICIKKDQARFESSERHNNGGNLLVPKVPKRDDAYENKDDNPEQLISI